MEVKVRTRNFCFPVGIMLSINEVESPDIYAGDGKLASQPVRIQIFDELNITRNIGLSQESDRHLLTALSILHPVSRAQRINLLATEKESWIVGASFLDPIGARPVPSIPARAGHERKYIGHLTMAAGEALPEPITVNALSK